MSGITEPGSYGAPLFNENHIIEVTEKAFDDFADSGMDEAINKKILGIN